MNSPKMLNKKRIDFSSTERAHIIMPGDVNSSFHLFGGLLMQWIDEVAGIVARRHAASEVLTAAIDHLIFLGPVHIDETVTLKGRITYVGTTSMEVCVETFVEKKFFPQEKKLVNRAFLTMVSINNEKRPQAVPKIVLETERQVADFEMGKLRRKLRLENKRQIEQANNLGN